MAKTETVHTRVTPEIKKKADSIFESIGLTTSQAITLFLTVVVNCNGMPFALTVPSEDEIDWEFAKSIAMVDGVEPSEETKKIFMLYRRGDIDLETAKFAIRRLYK